jgi:hypothetical protein
MKQQRPPFMPVTPDIDDTELERLAAGKGVGALVKPTDAPPRAAEVAAVPQPVAPTPVLEPRTRLAAGPIATPRSRMKSINLELPDYVWTDLKIRAAHAQTSVRHIVMAALRANGIVISDADMIEDGRRLRN